MAANYPSSLPSFTSLSAGANMDDTGLEGDVVVNKLQDEVTAIGTELGTAPKTITQATTPAASPSSVAEFLDMVATQLKAISGGTNWYSSITNSLADLVTHIAATAVHGATGAVVGTTNSQTLTNKTLTAPVIATISNTGTLTLPTSTDTLVGKATTDTLTNKTLTTPTITKPVVSATNPTAQTYTPSAAATATLDLSLSNQHYITMPAGNITIALSNDTNNQVFLISTLQDGTGSRTVTWFATIRWAGGAAPTLTTTASKRDVFGFIRTGTATYDGFVIGQNI